MTMTDTEAKALALVNEFRAKCAEPTLPVTMSHVWAYGAAWEALCRAIEREAATEASHAAELREQAERFSEAARCALAEALKADTYANERAAIIGPILAPFILPAPDPLVEAVGDALEGQGMGRPSHTTTEITARLRAAIEAHGGKIVWEAGE